MKWTTSRRGPWRSGRYRVERSNGYRGVVECVYRAFDGDEFLGAKSYLSEAKRLCQIRKDGSESAPTASAAATGPSARSDQQEDGVTNYGT